MRYNQGEFNLGQSFLVSLFVIVHQTEPVQVEIDV